MCIIFYRPVVLIYMLHCPLLSTMHFTDQTVDTRFDCSCFISNAGDDNNAVYVNFSVFFCQINLRNSAKLLFTLLSQIC